MLRPIYASRSMICARIADRRSIDGGKEVEAAEELQRIKEIDATMAPLLAAAKEQLLKAQQTTCHSKLPSSRLPPLTDSKSEPPFLRRLSNMLRR